MEALQCPEIPQNIPADSARQPLKLDLELELITPMFGGGVLAGEADPVTLIRVPSIRGQLRFWWRATHSAVFASSEDFFKAEEKIWGSTDEPSAVSLQVECPKGHARRECATEYGFQKFGPEMYALFSAKNNGKDLIKEGLQFTLHLRYRDSVQQDVRAALFAWINFGGLGARTRRGCGSLFCRQEDFSARTREELFKRRNEIEGSRLFLSARSFDGAMTAWKNSVEVYQAFRQKEYRGPKHKKQIGREGKEIEVPGRSRWPEPDSIRRLTGCALRSAPAGPDPSIDTHCHDVPVVPEEVLPAFPRAALGLPIVFHFSDGPKKGEREPQNRDPGDGTLVPLRRDSEGRDKILSRMASPIITKAIRVGDGWRAAFLFLPHKHLSSLEACFEGVSAEGQKISVPISHERIMGADMENVVPMQGKCSAVEGLAAFLLRNGFTEVAP
jgi:CRISPR-associated protein Cmr1